MDLKERIIQKASELFFKNGIRSVTMSDIANHLGISKRTLYEVFRDKEELLEVCLDTHMDRAEGELNKLIDSSEDVISAMMQIYAKHLNEMHTAGKTTLYDFKKYHPRLYKKIQNKQKRTIAMFHPLFREGVEQGLLFDNIDFEICIWMIKSQFVALLEGESLPLDKFSINQFIRAIILTFVRGIATPKGNKRIDEIVAKLNGS